MTSFTQSDLDEVLDGLFTANGLNELNYNANTKTWLAWYLTGNGESAIVTGDTASKAIRTAIAAIVVRRLEGK